MVELADSYLKIVKESPGREGRLSLAVYGAARLENGMKFEKQ